jgi:hypothetical protein
MKNSIYTREAIRRMEIDLINEDNSPMAVMRASIKEIASAWESYNGPIPKEFYRVENV